MEKGGTVRVALIVVAVFLVLSGNWAAALLEATFVHLGRIAAMLIERRRATSAELPAQ